MRELFGRLVGGKDDDKENKDIDKTSSDDATVESVTSSTKSNSVPPPGEGEQENASSELEETRNRSPFENNAAIPLEMAVEGAIGLDITQPMNALLEQTAIAPRQSQNVKEHAGPPRFEAVQRCHIGNIRGRNEDSSYIFTADTGGQEPLLPFGLYIVADGMGGHHAGHEASRNVSRQVAQDVLERIYVPSLINSVTDQGKAQEPIGEVMINAVQAANQNIFTDEPEKDSGTTLTAALAYGRRLYIAHVGDSRAYLLTNGNLEQLTTDHSYVRRLIDAGQLTEEEAAVHPQRNMLYKAVGQGGDLDIDTYTQSLPKSGKLLVCSDGLWGLVPDPIMQRVVEQDTSLITMADQLVDLALQSGGHDNISVVLVSFSF